MHIPIALLIGSRHHYLVAAVLLLIFGLFDTLDGELARLQGRSSARGMLLDASTDRFKEMMLYTGIAYALALGPHPAYAAFAAAACGASLSVSYVKAKGEAAVAATKNIPHAVLNKLFKDGLLTFELRMFALIVALAIHQLGIVVAIIAALASYTALQRLVRISKALT
jgi:phosphatidylglycerophosphate synthase